MWRRPGVEPVRTEFRNTNATDWIMWRRPGVEPVRTEFRNTNVTDWIMWRPGVEPVRTEFRNTNVTDWIMWRRPGVEPVRTEFRNTNLTDWIINTRTEVALLCEGTETGLTHDFLQLLLVFIIMSKIVLLQKLGGLLHLNNFKEGTGMRIPVSEVNTWLIVFYSCCERREYTRNKISHERDKKVTAKKDSMHQGGHGIRFLYF